jgi:branched-chain amino acid transport system ATP-binding protein
MALLEIRDVKMQFGGLTAVDDLTMDVEPGEIHAVIGPNGAGKTTLINVLTGVYPATSGCVSFNGEKIDGLRPYERVKLGMARTFQNLRIFPSLSVRENANVSQFCRTSSSTATTEDGLLMPSRMVSTMKVRAFRPPSSLNAG